jgi:hypothetical protein
MLKVVRWDDDDTITHELLRMRITVLTQLSISRATFVCLCCLHQQGSVLIALVTEAASTSETS